MLSALRASTEPRLLQRGNRDANVFMASGNIASTEPRLLQRGNAARWIDHHNESKAASTEPRLLQRGNSLPLRIRLPPILSFNGAAPFTARKSYHLPSAGYTFPGLQRSRAFYSAEMSQVVGMRSLTPAASTEPRLLQRGNLSMICWGRLSIQ